MFDFVKKLMFARQLKMERGNLVILGQRAMITPAWTFSYVLKETKDYWETANLLYLGCKLSTQEGFSKGLFKKFNIKNRDLPKWLKNVNELAGNGLTEILKIDTNIFESVIKVSDSPVVETFGKADIPVDHPLRGYFAGGASASFGCDVDCIEVSCQAVGHKFCKFIIMPKKKLLEFIESDNNLKINKDILKKQIGIFK